MALNGNHQFEDLNDKKCAIVEKECSSERVAYLKQILEYNGYEVVVVPSPPPKGAKPASDVVSDVSEPKIMTFTIGVTDTSFSPIKTVVNRELKKPGGGVVSMDYWKQRPEKEWYWK
ncbi:MAG: hypothetical protein LCH37_02630 [Bacteroidetes bacterium]|nr:hypothetical protein [Bacteroidota bacterium]